MYHSYLGSIHGVHACRLIVEDAIEAFSCGGRGERALAQALPLAFALALARALIPQLASMTHFQRRNLIDSLSFCLTSHGINFILALTYYIYIYYESTKVVWRAT